MNRFIIDYNQYLYKNTAQFGGFDLTEKIIDDTCKRISLEEFNTMEFDDSDLVIFPLFTMHEPENYTHRYVEFINTFVNQKNYNREKTIILIGTQRESKKNYHTLKSEYRVDKYIQLYDIFRELKKDKQKIKLYVSANIDLPNVQSLPEHPNPSISYLVQTNSFLQMAKFNFLTEPTDRDGTGQLYYDATTDLNYPSADNIFEQNIDKINKLQDRNYLFTMLSRNSKPDRFINFYNTHRYNVFNKGMISYHNFKEIPKQYLIDTLDEWGCSPSPEFLRFFDEWHSKDNVSIDEYDVTQNLAFNLVPSHYLDSYVQVIGESYVSNQFILISEKTYKTILCGSPFFILGNDYTLDALKQIGFETFDKWWDESYDGNYSHWESSKKVFSSLYDLSKLSKTQLNKMLEEQKEILIHNRDNLKYLIDRDNYLMDIINYITKVTL